MTQHQAAHKPSLVFIFNWFLYQKNIVLRSWNNAGASEYSPGYWLRRGYQSRLTPPSKGFSEDMSVVLGHRFPFAQFNLLGVVGLYMTKVKRVDNAILIDCHTKPQAPHSTLHHQSPSKVHQGKDTLHYNIQQWTKTSTYYTEIILLSCRM